MIFQTDHLLWESRLFCKLNLLENDFAVEACFLKRNQSTNTQHSMKINIRHYQSSYELQRLKYKPAGNEVYFPEYFVVILENLA